MEFFNLKQPPGANKYPQYTAVYSKYTAVYSRVYGRILRYWSLEYTAVYPKSPKWGIFKHNIDHHNWQTRGIPQPTYACIVHYTFVPTCTCHIPLSPKTPFFTRILPGIPGMTGYAHHSGDSSIFPIRHVVKVNLLPCSSCLETLITSLVLNCVCGGADDGASAFLCNCFRTASICGDGGVPLAPVRHRGAPVNVFHFGHGDRYLELFASSQ